MTRATAKLHRTMDRMRRCAARRGSGFPGHGREERARAAGDAPAAFLAVMSHGIRTPLAAILGYAELLAEGTQSAEDRAGCAAVIRLAGEHLLGLVDGAEELWRIEAGEVAPEPVETFAARVAEEVYSLMQVRAMEEGVDLRLEQELPLCAFRSDPMRLRQVLIHLVDDAIRSAERGMVVLRTFMDRPGPGRARIVNFQVRAADAGRGEWGPCLAMTERLVEFLGGQITFEREPGRGSVATLSLVVLPDREAQLARDAGRRMGQEPVRLRGRVLVCEDAPEMQRLVARLLRRAGAEVEVAGDGRAGVKAARRSLEEGRPFDLVLVNVQLPELDGLGAVGLLRKEGWAGPIVALTAPAMRGDRERFLAAGCDDCLAKPLDAGGLLAVCSAWLTGELRRGAAA